jgi:two-component system KDP operon response regulator KdpE
MSEVVVLDADQHARTELAHALMEAEFSVIECADGPDALRQVFARRPEAIVMDLQVQQFDGLELIRVLRAASDLPIIVTGSGTVGRSVARVLDMGADDFIEKPQRASELTARVRAAVRRYRRSNPEPALPGVIRTGSLTFDRDSQTVTKHGEVVSLTRTEGLLLDALFTRIGRVASHRYLLSAVWGDQYIDDTHYVRVYMGALRNKLEDNPADPRLLLTEWGIGYRLAALPVETEQAVASVSEYGHWNAVDAGAAVAVA